MMSTSPATSEITSAENTSAAGEVMPSPIFSAEEMLDFIERNTTLHNQVELLYVVDGYEAAVTYDGAPQSPVHKGSTVRDALCALMQGMKTLEKLGR